MDRFRVCYTGDYLDASGAVPYGDIGRARLDAGGLEYEFLKDHQPAPGGASADQLYDLQITPEHVARANGIIIFRPWVKASAFAKGAANLIAIGRAGAGYDKIDLDACTASDVVVFNAPDTLTHSTASSALLLILALAKRLPEQERMARGGSWEGQAALMGNDLPGMTLGIIGLGKSGLELARLIAPFQMNVIAYSPRVDPAVAAAAGVKLRPSLEAVMRESDFISLHNRLDERTRGMIGEEQLSWMKPSAYFVNVARGEIVDEAALIRLLRDRRIAGAGLDVFEHEPLPASSPMLALDNVIVTPHWLPSTHQAADATMRLMADGMIDVAARRIPPNVLNPAVLQRPAFRRKLERQQGQVLA